MLAHSPLDIIRIARIKLMRAMLLRPQPRKAQTIKLVRVRVQRLVVVLQPPIDLEHRALWQELAVGQRQVFHDHALEGREAGRVEALRLLDEAVEFVELVHGAAPVFAAVVGEDFFALGSEEGDVFGVLEEVIQDVG